MGHVRTIGRTYVIISPLTYCVSVCPWSYDYFLSMSPSPSIGFLFIGLLPPIRELCNWLLHPACATSACEPVFFLLVSSLGFFGNRRRTKDEEGWVSLARTVKKSFIKVF